MRQQHISDVAGAEVTARHEKCSETIWLPTKQEQKRSVMQKFTGEQFAISVCPADNIESPTIVGAQAANELLNIIGIKASFVLTPYQGKIYVSSRSIDEINVQLIMERAGRRRTSECCRSTADRLH